MGGDYLGTARVLGAMLLATGIIVGAYTLAHNANSPRAVQASTEEELLKTLATRDTDGDGLRDWEETLYGTDPNKTDTRNLGMTDGEAVAKGLVVPIAPETEGGPATLSTNYGIAIPEEGTITRALAENLFASYAKALQSSRTGTLTSDQIRKLSDDAFSRLNEMVIPAPDYKSERDLKISGSSQEALKTYAASAEAVFRAHRTTADKVDVVYLETFLEEGDASVLPHLMSISKMYQDTASGLSAIPVPEGVAKDHLLLINTMSRLSKIVADFTRADSDPFATLLALQRYPDSMRQLGTGFINVNRFYRSAGVTFTPEEPGAAFVGVVETVAEEQRKRAGSNP